MALARLLMLLFCALLLSSCQQKSTALNQVSGKVLYKGAILSGGIIVFSPDASRGESGKIALGKIQSDGTYTLSTDEAAGASAGWYRVTVAAVTGTEKSPVALVPDRYRDPQLSLLQCEVKPNRDNHLDFNLD